MQRKKADTRTICCNCWSSDSSLNNEAAPLCMFFYCFNLCNDSTLRQFLTLDLRIGRSTYTVRTHCTNWRKQVPFLSLQL